MREAVDEVSSHGRHRDKRFVRALRAHEAVEPQETRRVKWTRPPIEIQQPGGHPPEIRTERQSLTFQIALGGEWMGARFEHRVGGWIFVSFVSGDIP